MSDIGAAEVSFLPRVPGKAVYVVTLQRLGRVAEWFKAHAWKVCVR
jgi:hypothetical protein